MNAATRLALILPALLAPLAAGQAPAPKGDELPRYALTRIGDTRFFGGGHRLRFAPDGKTLAVAHHDKLRLLDAVTGRLLRLLPHVRPPNVKTADPIPTTVVELAFTADGKAIVTGDEDGGLHLWKTADGSESRWPARHPGLATLCLAADGQSLFTGGFDGILRQWRFPSMQPIQIWQAPGKEPILALAAAAKQVAGVTRDGTLFLWDLATRKTTRTTDLGPVRLGGAFDFAARVFPARGSTYPSFATYPRNVVFSPDGKRLVQHQGQQVWDVQAGKVIANLPPGKGTVHLAFSADGKRVAAGPTAVGQPLRLFDAASGEEIGQLDAGRIAAVTFAPDGQTVAFATDQAVRLWKPATKEVLGGADAIGTVRDWDLSADGKQLAIATREKGVRLYDALTGKHVETFATGPSGADLIRYRPDGQGLVVAIAGEGLAQYERKGGAWQLVRKITVREPLKEIHGPASLVAFGVTSTRLIDAQTGKPQPGLAPRTKYLHFTFSPDGRQLLVAAEVPPKPPAPAFARGQLEYQLLRLPGLTVVRSIKELGRGLPRWRFSPDGRLGVLDTNPVRVVEVLSGADRLSVKLPFRPTSLEFTPDGNSLLAGTAQGEILVLGLPKGQVLYRTGVVHKAAVKELRLTRRQQLISEGQDQTLLVWSADLWKGRSASPSLKLDDEDLDLFYQRLKETGGDNVGSALASMTAAGDVTVRFLKKRLKPAVQAAKASPLGLPSGERLRSARSLELLERIGTGAAREVLADLARGHPNDPQTIEAKESLARLSMP